MLIPKKKLIFLIFLIFLFFCGNTALLSAQPDEFVPNVARVGDPSVSYLNVEFSSDGKYMIWLERKIENGKVRHINWHCGIDPETGELIPSDGKGFKAFESHSSLSRANPGMDKKGAFYIGMDTEGRLIFVRPTSPMTGEVSTLSTPPDITRRAIYPTDLPDHEDGYAFWIKNEKIPGPGNLPLNDWFELQYIKISEPERIYSIERQKKPARGFAPFDMAFARAFRKKPLLTYGFYDKNYLQIRQFDFTKPESPPTQITIDPFSKIDPYPLVFNGMDVLIAGINGKAYINVYTRSSNKMLFNLAQSFYVPESTSLENPSLAQSSEPFIFNNKLYVAYQVNDKGRKFQDATFYRKGEIWIAELLQADHQKQWRVSDNDDMAKFEPEPYVGRSKAWVFYNAIPAGANIYKETWGLYRAETPINATN